MATYNISPCVVDDLPVVTLVATGAELNDVVIPQCHAVIRDIFFEIPNGITLTVKVEPDPTNNGPNVVLINTTASGATQTGLVGGGHVVPKNGKITITTSGGAAGSRKVTIALSPARIGV